MCHEFVFHVVLQWESSMYSFWAAKRYVRQTITLNLYHPPFYYTQECFHTRELEEYENQLLTTHYIYIRYKKVRRSPQHNCLRPNCVLHQCHRENSRQQRSIVIIPPSREIRGTEPADYKLRFWSMKFNDHLSQSWPCFLLN